VDQETKRKSREHIVLFQSSQKKVSKKTQNSKKVLTIDGKNNKFKYYQKVGWQVARPA
jgi:hypothetical protein